MRKKIPWTDTIIYARPEEEFIFIKKEKVEGMTCDKCGGGDIQKYPIANWMGPRIVIKCQDCFNIIKISYPEREDQWPPYWPVTHDWPVSLSEKATVTLLQCEEQKNK